jgi:hypothetical protein
MVRSSYKWSIGTGNDIPVWEHRWVFDGSVLTKPASEFNLTRDSFRPVSVKRKEMEHGSY